MSRLFVYSANFYFQNSKTRAAWNIVEKLSQINISNETNSLSFDFHVDLSLNIKLSQDQSQLLYLSF